MFDAYSSYNTTGVSISPPFQPFILACCIYRQKRYENIKAMWTACNISSFVRGSEHTWNVLSSIRFSVLWFQLLPVSISTRAQRHLGSQTGNWQIVWISKIFGVLTNLRSTNFYRVEICRLILVCHISKNDHFLTEFFMGMFCLPLFLQ